MCLTVVITRVRLERTQGLDLWVTAFVVSRETCFFFCYVDHFSCREIRGVRRNRPALSAVKLRPGFSFKKYYIKFSCVLSDQSNFILWLKNLTQFFCLFKSSVHFSMSDLWGSLGFYPRASPVFIYCIVFYCIVGFYCFFYGLFICHCFVDVCYILKLNTVFLAPPLSTKMAWQLWGLDSFNYWSFNQKKIEDRSHLSALELWNYI